MGSMVVPPLRPLPAGEMQRALSQRSAPAAQLPGRSHAAAPARPATLAAARQLFQEHAVSGAGAAAPVATPKARSRVAAMATGSPAGSPVKADDGRVMVKVAELRELAAKALKTLGYRDQEVEELIEVGTNRASTQPSQ